jgi:hypothetical protein
VSTPYLGRMTASPTGPSEPLTVFEQAARLSGRRVASLIRIWKIGAAYLPLSRTWPHEFSRTQHDLSLIGAVVYNLPLRSDRESGPSKGRILT